MAEQGNHPTIDLFAKPKRGLEGKFSVLYNAAAALMQGKIDIDTFTDERVADPTIGEMMDRVRVRVLDRWEVDGRTLVKNVVPAEVLGSAKNPWSFEAIREKFESNAGLTLAEEKTKEASRIWSDIDQINDLGKAMPSLVP